MFWILVLNQLVVLLAREHGLTVPPTETSGGPEFVFPEEGDAYFGQNVDALKASLSLALEQDCLRSWPLNESVEIAIIFRHDGYVPETSQYYIQYQMEQIASLQTDGMDAGFRNFANNMQYKMKLGRALQIWEWSPRQVAFLQNHMSGMMSQKVKHVPLWTSVAVDSGPTCDDILEQPTCESDPGTDVLFFGYLTKSRQHLCADVDAEMERLRSDGQLFSHECVSGVFGPALQCKICKATIVYSDHSRNDSVLEVHRINPLLALGKAVISAISADTFLDTEYSGALELVPAVDIPVAISRLLLDDQARTKLEWNAYWFAKQQKAQAQPALCRALNDLATAVEINAVPQRNVGLERHERYLAVRRLVTNSTNGTSGTGSSSTSSAVTTTATDATSLASGTTTSVAGVSTTPASTTNESTSFSTSTAFTTTATGATSLASGTTTSVAGVSTTPASTTNGANSFSTSLAVTTTATSAGSLASGMATSSAGVSTTPASPTHDTNSSSTSSAFTITQAGATELANGTSSTPAASITLAAFSSTTALSATASTAPLISLSTTFGPASAVMTSSIPGTSSTPAALQFTLDDPYGDSRADQWRALSPACWAIIIVSLTRG